MSGSNPFRHRKPAVSTPSDTADDAPRGGSGAIAQPPALPPRAGNSGGEGLFGGAGTFDKAPRSRDEICDLDS